MVPINVETLRAQVRAMDFPRGTPSEVTQWRDDNENSRANIILEGFRFEPDEDALFAMLMAEGVPPAIVTRIVLGLFGGEATAPYLAVAQP